MHHPRCTIEPLESRTLFSAAAPVAAAGVPQLLEQPATTAKLASAGTGVTLNLQADVPFTGQVAFIPLPAADLTPSALIEWGGGNTSAGTIDTTTQAGVSGYEVIGSHTYINPGTYTIVTQMDLRPTSSPAQATPMFIVAEPPVISTAIVAPAPVSTGTSGTGTSDSGNSDGGTSGSGSSSGSTTAVDATPAIVNIQEVTATQFTVELGSFTTVAPGTHLRATINWGDGKTSVGKLIASGTEGDQVTFQVRGTHKYKNAGTYGIAINIIKLPASASSANSPIASFDSVADVVARPAK